MNVQLDTLGGSVTRTRTGWTVTRQALVTGLDGPPAELLTRALGAPGLPAIGSVHPSAPGAVLESIAVQGLDESNGEARLTLNYATPLAEHALPGGRGGVKILGVEFFAATLTERATEDAAGRTMINFFRGPLIGGTGAVISIEAAREVVEADVFRPQLGVRIQHERQALPRELAPRVIGTVNADDWSGYPPFTWLCIAMNADNRNEGGVWNCTFEALYRPQGWRLRHVIRVGGIPPEQAARGNGIAVFDVYDARPWRELGIVF